MTEEMSKVTRNQWQLIQVLMKHSKAQNWDDAKKEWNLQEIFHVREPQTCICGHHPINEIIHVFNIGTKITLTVGNCCVNKIFDVDEGDKIFSALRKGKINAEIIERAYKEDVIDENTRDFLMNVWRKRRLSLKQSKWRNDATKKILGHFLK